MRAHLLQLTNSFESTHDHRITHTFSFTSCPLTRTKARSCLKPPSTGAERVRFPPRVVSTAKRVNMRSKGLGLCGGWGFGRFYISLLCVILLNTRRVKSSANCLAWCMGARPDRWMGGESKHARGKRIKVTRSILQDHAIQHMENITGG